MQQEGDVIKVALIEDQQVIREGLAYLLDGTDGFSCTGSYVSIEQALQRIKEDVPQVVLVDIGLPGITGIEGIRLLKERWPELLCITLTVYEDDEKIFDSLCAGASGYLLKRTPPAKLVESLRGSSSGSSVVYQRSISSAERSRPAQSGNRSKHESHSFCDESATWTRRAVVLSNRQSNRQQ
jgi:DNA-binding NarL/FixJ family response regulator